MDTTTIRAEVEKLQSEMKELEEKRQALDEKIAPTQKELEYWVGILALRENKNGSKPLSMPTPALKADTFHQASATPDINQEYGTKARKMREYILSRKDSGVTMRELVQVAASLGARSQLAYQFVNRQRKAKPPKLEKRGKKFYATEAMTLD